MSNSLVTLFLQLLLKRSAEIILIIGGQIGRIKGVSPGSIYTSPVPAR